MSLKTKIKFSDIKRLKKGDPIPFEANAIAREVLSHVENGLQEQLLEELKTIENLKWFGVWYAANGEFVFRKGVCQSIKKNITLKNSSFRINIINEDVSFETNSKDLQNG